MPESPEVQALTEFLDAHITGHRIEGVELEEYRALKTRNRPLETLVGTTVQGVERRGKHIDVALSASHLVIGFGRAGWARWAPPGGSETAPPPDAPPVIARLRFDDGAELGLTDAGAWLSMSLSVVEDAADVPAVAKLGPDPTDESYGFELFDAVLDGRRKQVKALLQEQESLAGIGNAYSDEILHVARLSPVAHAATLDADERHRLYDAVRDVLGGAFAARRGIPIDQQKAQKVASMRVHGRSGETCPVCGDVIRDVPGSKGGAQYCPTCQTGGVALDS